MQPQEPAQPPTPSNYDFFLNPAPAPKPTRLPNVPGVRDPFLKRLILIVGGGLVVIIVVWVLASLVFGTKSSAGLLSVAQAQTELIRVATNATHQANTQTTKNLAVNTQLTLTTEQQQLLVYAAKHGTKIKPKQLSLTKNATTDQRLANAQAASNFDPVFAQVMQTQLKTYADTIKQAFNGTTSKTERQLLNTDYAAANLLLTQATAASSSTPT